MKVALVIPIFNRPQYVKRCFASLEKLTVKPDIIVLVDDCSDKKYDLYQLIESFTSLMTNSGVFECGILSNEKNIGVKGSLLRGINAAFRKGAGMVITLDSDAIVKPDFVKRLVELHKETGLISSGFNNPKEPTISKKENSHIIKKHANGINMCFNREQYEKHVKPALLAKTGNWDYMASESAGNVAITIPSCVQHIGMQSSMGHKGADIAQDFKILSLPDVTLFGIDSHDKIGIKRAAEISQRDIEFGAVNIITDDLFTKGANKDVRIRDYSRFMMKELTDHFDTSHVLTIHADGYVLNPDAWDNEWLQYDYIGATWWYKDNCNVGNGGFSLRSKKLCKILAEYELEHIHPEDHHICRTYRAALENLGIKFAPEDVANKFSIEAYGVPPPHNKYDNQFGFHGVHVDMSMLPSELQYSKTKKSSSVPLKHRKKKVHLR